MFLISMLLFPSKWEGAVTHSVDVMVLLKKSAESSVITDVGGKIRYQAKSIPFYHVIIPESGLQQLKKHPLVEVIEENHEVNIQSPNEDWGIEDVHELELYTSQSPNWGFKALSIKKAHEKGFTGKKVKIAVIDTGILSSHDDLRVKGGMSFVDYTDEFEDDNGHGTHVAGIIGAINNQVGIVGVAPDAELYAIKVLDQYGSGRITSIASGIDWAIQNKMDVINLSIGTGLEYSIIAAFLDKAYEEGIVTVAAAGNTGDQSNSHESINFPANHPTTIAVGSIDSNYKRSNFSSTGPELTVTAPGNTIASTFIHNQYAKMSGTSMAAPFVTGIVALLLEANPAANPEKIKAAIQASSIDLGQPGIDSQYGSGLVHVPVDSLELASLSFSDVKTHWARSDINYLYTKNMISGYPNQTFKPDKQVTRAEFAAMLVKGLNLSNKDGQAIHFKDDQKIEKWARTSIQIAAKHGLLRGKLDHNGQVYFDPSAVITRAELAVIFSRLVAQPTETMPSTKMFDDQATIPIWAKKGVQISVQSGLLSGYKNNHFGANDPVTRAQGAAILSRYIKHI